VRVIPAVDLLGGQCVRLRQGDYNQQQVFSDDPAAMAAGWVAQGAELLHVVDLDGARDGVLHNLGVVQHIVEAVDVPVQVGGGMRTTDAVRRVFDAGVARAIVGTRALEDPDWFAELCTSFPDRIVLGLDARDGQVATHGWLQISEIQAPDLAREMDRLPLAGIVYTDIRCDGMLRGPNVEATERLARAVTTPVIASGGVSTVDDVRRLASGPVWGCILGRALYEGTIELRDALDAARGCPPPVA